MNIIQNLLFILFLAILGCKGKSVTSDSVLYPQLGKKESPRSNVYSGYLDSKGNLWFGTLDNGVYMYNKKGFLYYTLEHFLCNEKISCISEDNKGNLMFGTHKGVCVFDGKGFEFLEIPKYKGSTQWLRDRFPIIAPNEVQSILQDKKGDFWFGTNGAGVYHYDGNEFTNYLYDVGDTMPDGLYHNIIQSMIEDKNGDIWLGSMSHGGVSKYSNGRFEHLSVSDGLSDNMVRVIYEDRKGKIWIGFNGNRESGLTVVEGEKFTTFREKDGLCTKNIRAIHEDKEGNIWIGGQQGLCVFNGKEFIPLWDENGEVFSRILFIIGDHDNNVWFGGQNGFWKHYEGQTVRVLS